MNITIYTVQMHEVLSRKRQWDIATILGVPVRNLKTSEGKRTQMLFMQ